VEIMIVVAVGVFLMVAWTVGGWVIVRMGFTRDSDAASRAGSQDDDGTRPVPDGPVPVDPASDPNAIWREQMKAATAASGAACTCPRRPVGTPSESPAGSGEQGAAVDSAVDRALDPAADHAAVDPSPDCPIHRWDYA